MQHDASAAACDPPGDVQQPVAHGRGCGDGQVAVEGEDGEPGEQVLGCQVELQSAISSPPFVSSLL